MIIIIRMVIIIIAANIQMRLGSKTEHEMSNEHQTKHNNQNSAHRVRWRNHFSSRSRCEHFSNTETGLILYSGRLGLQGCEIKKLRYCL